MGKSSHWLSRNYRLTLIILSAIFFGANLYAQERKGLSIDEAYHLAKKNYPLLKQRDLITKAKDYSLANAATGYLPVFSLNGQATYQSDVTTFPFDIPFLEMPEYSKDQYRVYAEINQVIYDGGYIKNQRETAKASEVVQQQNLEVELYGLYERVNQLFFGSLLMEEQLKANDLLLLDIQNGIDQANALVDNGYAYQSSVDELMAQLLQVQQARIEIHTTRKAFLNMLGLFIGSKLDNNTILEKPGKPVSAKENTRPELLAIDYQKRIYDLQGKLLNVQLKPQLGLFAQGGYGRPGLNFLSDDFEWYYIGGLRLNWNFGSLYNIKRQHSLLDIKKSSLDIQKEAFLLNSQISVQQNNAALDKYDSLIKKDDAIIILRRSVKMAAFAQLENGVISAHDYISQVNAEDKARQNKILHEMQLLQSQYSYQNIMGNINNK